MESNKAVPNGSRIVNKTLPPTPNWDEENTVNKSLPPTEQASPNALRELDILLRDSPGPERHGSQEVRSSPN
jgi:hypothetical protein